MGKRKNDFLLKTKTLLAKRAGYKCCYLGCGQSTIGPSKEKKNSDVSDTGVAAHIYSASRNGKAKRNPPESISDEVISSIGNGIWMCQTHGKYIDDDEVTFTVEQLKKWKIIGEDIARKMQEFRISYDESLNELAIHDPNIPPQISFAQDHDPIQKKTHKHDFNLYKKIMRMIPKEFRKRARQGDFSFGPYDEVNPADKYQYDVNNDPVEYTFLNQELENKKQKMNQALDDLLTYFAKITIPHKTISGCFFHNRMDIENGDNIYEKEERKMSEHSIKFINAFDVFHSSCKELFKE